MPSPMDIYKLLPKTNCKLCGEQTCMSFAFKLLRGEKNLTDCKPLFEKEFEENRRKLEEILSVVEKATETGLVVNEELCIGCGNCVVVCPVHVYEDPDGAGSGFGVRLENPILRVENGRVRVVDVGLCRRYKDRTICVACRECCPTSAIAFLEEL